jgi:hypothetical protein
MLRSLSSACFCVALMTPSWGFGQMKPSDAHEHGSFTCDESPTPGKRPPNLDCALLVRGNSLRCRPVLWSGVSRISRRKRQRKEPHLLQALSSKRQEKFGSSPCRPKALGRKAERLSRKQTGSLRFPLGPAMKSSSTKQTSARKPLFPCTHIPDRRRGTCSQANNV